MFWHFSVFKLNGLLYFTSASSTWDCKCPKPRLCTACSVVFPMRSDSGSKYHSNSDTKVNTQASEESSSLSSIKIIFSQLPASRLIDWWWGHGDPDSSASAAFCGFSVSHAEPGAVGWWREWLHRDGLAPESCQCAFHDSMHSDVRDQAEVTLLHIISGSHPDGVMCGWRSSRCCIKSYPTAKKSWTAWLTAAWASGFTTHFYKGRWNESTFVSLNNCGHHSPNTYQVSCPGRDQWVLTGTVFLCVFSLESSYVWPNLNYQLSSYESAEVVSTPAYYTRTYWNQTSPSNAWNVCFPSLNAISCSQWLFPLITLTLNSICLIK